MPPDSSDQVQQSLRDALANCERFRTIALSAQDELAATKKYCNDLAKKNTELYCKFCEEHDNRVSAERILSMERNVLVDLELKFERLIDDMKRLRRNNVP